MKNEGYRVMFPRKVIIRRGWWSIWLMPLQIRRAWEIILANGWRHRWNPIDPLSCKGICIF